MVPVGPVATGPYDAAATRLLSHATVHRYLTVTFPRSTHWVFAGVPAGASTYSTDGRPPISTGVADTTRVGCAPYRAVIVCSSWSWNCPAATGVDHTVTHTSAGPFGVSTISYRSPAHPAAPRIAAAWSFEVLEQEEPRVELPHVIRVAHFRRTTAAAAGA